MDFTLKTYQSLLKSLLKQNYVFQTFQEYIEKPKSRTIIPRHDVDKLPKNSLHFAQIQHALGIKGSYYFRIVPESYNVEIIEKIANLGHEIGYHYEDIDLTIKSMKNEKLRIDNKEEIAQKAIKLFEKHLAELRKYYPVKTICMHGSPLSKYDNKLLWKYYNYRDWGIIGEPYFDVNFSKVLYLTDTGRKWDGAKVSIRDKVSSHNSQITPDNYRDHKIPTTLFHSTNDIIKAATTKQLPNQIMFTFHPQRWTAKTFPWVKELVFQNLKNIVKYFILKF